MMTATVLAEDAVDVLAARVLDAAGDRIEKDGFGQSAFFDPVTGLYCTMGAIATAAQVLVPDWWRCEEVIDLAVASVSTRVGVYAPVWNDVPGRTRAEVVGALRGSARDLSLAA
jgi:hypothetical protein